MLIDDAFLMILAPHGLIVLSLTIYDLLHNGQLFRIVALGLFDFLLKCSDHRVVDDLLTQLIVLGLKPPDMLDFGYGIQS
jgi:hypothetical protein